MKAILRKGMVVFLLLAGTVAVHGQTFSVTKAGGSAQESKNEVLDTATIRCYYLYETRYEGQLRRDTMVLDIGDHYSRFYNPARLSRDSVVRAMMANLNPATIKSISVLKDASARDLSNLPGTTVGSNSNEGESYQIVKERAANKLSYTDYTSVMGELYQYQDELGPLPWKLSDSSRTILSYPANKANLSFRGRTYTAWFTPEIPVNDGPWKFMGLPGLIVQIEDARQEVAFRLIGLEQLRTGVPIAQGAGKIFKCSRTDLAKLKKKQDAGMQINNNAGAVTISTLPGPFNYFAIEVE